MFSTRLLFSPILDFLIPVNIVQNVHDNNHGKKSKINLASKLLLELGALFWCQVSNQLGRLKAFLLSDRVLVGGSICLMNHLGDFFEFLGVGTHDERKLLAQISKNLKLSRKIDGLLR